MKETFSSISFHVLFGQNPKRNPLHLLRSRIISNSLWVSKKWPTVRALILVKRFSLPILAIRKYKLREESRSISLPSIKPRCISRFRNVSLNIRNHRLASVAWLLAWFSEVGLIQGKRKGSNGVEIQRDNRQLVCSLENFIGELALYLDNNSAHG